LEVLEKSDYHGLKTLIGFVGGLSGCEAACDFDLLSLIGYKENVYCFADLDCDFKVKMFNPSEIEALADMIDPDRD
jgi:hypothetical protein